MQWTEPEVGVNLTEVLLLRFHLKLDWNDPQSV